MANPIRVFLFLLLVFATGVPPCVAADGIVIKYIIEGRGLTGSPTYLNLSAAKNRHNIFVPDFMKLSVGQRDRDPLSSPNGSGMVLTVDYPLDQAGCYFICEGVGRELLIDPTDKDTIIMHISQKSSIMEFSPTRGSDIALPGFLNTTIDDKHAYVVFFDSLNLLHGDMNVRMVYSYKQSKYRLQEYLTEVNKVYRDRLEFLYQFAERHYFPPKLRYYAAKEIQYAFYNDLLDPIVYFQNENQYPANMRDSIDNIKNDLNNPDLFDNTALYRKVIGDYVFNVMVKRDPVYWDRSHLSGCYQYCRQNLQGEIRDYTMGSVLASYIRSCAADTSSPILLDYARDHQKSIYYPLVDSMHRAALMAGRLLSPEEVLSQQFEDARDRLVRLKDVITKDIIVIDCWASWCRPCIEQMPFVDSLVAIYGGHIQFIALSLDEQPVKWHGFLGKQPLNPAILQLHAPEGFRHLFVKSLYINTIPRLLLLSRSGKFLNTRLPSPSAHMKDVKKMMEETIAKMSVEGTVLN